MQSGKQPELPLFGSGLDPAYRYLYVKPNDGVAAIFVLSFEKRIPQGLLEGWYSADGVYVSTLDGRLSAVHGYSVGWTQSSWQWQGGGRLVRTRDVSTNHLYGVVDIVESNVSTVQLAPVTLTGWLSRSSVPLSLLTWQVDRHRSSPVSQSLPDAWLAFGWHRGLYSMVASHQCLEPDFCFHLARWPLDQINSLPP